MLILFSVFETVTYYILKTLKPSKLDPVQIQETPIINPKKEPHKIESKPKKNKTHKKSRNQKELDEKILRVQKANDPGYKTEDSPFQVFLHQGVVTYRKKRYRKKEKS